MTAPAQLTCSYASLVNDIGFECFGLIPTATDLITEAKATGNQPSQILRAIRKGLQFVYGAHRWSFLRPKLSINTYAVYSTGTITVNSSGNVTLDAGIEPSDLGFPAYSYTGGGTLIITTPVGTTFFGGYWPVASRPTSTSLTLSGYDASGGPTITTAVSYSLVFNRYPIPTGYDSFDGEISYAMSWGSGKTPIQRVDPLEIRRNLQDDSNPGKPTMYAIFTNAFDPTVGSDRYFSFYPVPDIAYQLEVVGTWMPAMLDSSNLYPLGGTLLSGVITEACLAAAERDIKNIDEGHPDAVHCRAVVPLLQMAIKRDKEYSAPDTLGFDHGPSFQGEARGRNRQAGSVEWTSGGYVGFIP
jgi:hypothetical protein